ncbi:curli assembly protein CsgF [Methylobacter sp. sgz302048]|jgi:curli production assembly/transport component CsgF|uniref:curli assembly protein CsgF n=1 Tax=Methylobacter sp. sgz302048 TaxID=3455945 RepID=UPI003F9FA40B
MRLWIYLGLLAVFIKPLSATELVYRPVSPSFGGNPLNGSFLLNQAAEQNNFKDPAAVNKATAPQKSELERFKENLQRAILNQVSRTTTQNLFDEDGNIQLGSDLNFDLDGDGQSDFAVIVDEAPINGSVSISISDGISDTVLTVPYINTLSNP